MNQKTLLVPLMGRLGNQMFVYASAKAMALDNNCKLVYSDYAFTLINHKNRLNCFNLAADSIYSDTMALSRTERIGHFIYKANCRHKSICQVFEMEKRLQWIFRLFNTFHCQEGYIKPGKLTGKDNLAFGYFQSEKYFNEHEAEICKEFTFKTELFSERANNLAQQILSNTNTVCVHIRRGDYLNDPIFKVCDDVYYYKAIDKMHTLLPNATYYVFSDNIDEVREIFSKYENLNFVYIDSCFTDQESMYLGSCCSNFIMTNSSFSWWMQYLSKNKDKIVFAPSRWYGVERPCDIYQDNWQLIEV